MNAVQIYTSHHMGESQGIYVRPDEPVLNYTGIVTPYDMRGRVIGVPFGSTTHYQLLWLIDLLGLKGSVTVVNMSPPRKLRSFFALPIVCPSMFANPLNPRIDFSRNHASVGRCRN